MVVGQTAVQDGPDVVSYVLSHLHKHEMLTGNPGRCWGRHELFVARGGIQGIKPLVVYLFAPLCAL